VEFFVDDGKDDVVYGNEDVLFNHFGKGNLKIC
jgi:hypothetical protein